MTNRMFNVCYRLAPRSVFIHLAVVSSQICEIPRNSLKIRTCMFNFLLVINSKFGHISYRFRDIDSFRSKIAPRSSILVSIRRAYATSHLSLIATLDLFEILMFKAKKWVVFPPLFCLTSLVGGGVPFVFLGETCLAKTRGMGYPTVKILTSAIFD